MKHTMKRKNKEAAMVEYAVLLGAVLLVGILAMSMIGHKTGDILGAIAVILPGTHTDDNANITSAHLIETKVSGTGSAAVLTLDGTSIQNNSGTQRLGVNTGLTALTDSTDDTKGLGTIIVETGN